jgi:GTPase
MSFTVVIVGRPNVGKSTLFNRLVGRRLALVHDRPGVTRDRREGAGHLADLTFRVIDTAGLEDSDRNTLEGKMRGQTERAVAEADVALMVIDARAGITPMDAYFADLLRRGSTPIILAANKCEGNAAHAGLYEAFSLGFGEPIALSAEHGQGLDELYDALLPFDKTPPAEDLEPKAADDFEDSESTEDVVVGEDGEGLPDGPLEDDYDISKRPLQLAIVGRPNTGKSTLINRLLGEDRVLTGPEPGVTRDAIPIDWEYQGRPVRLVDTAGLRRKAKVNDAVEKLSALDTLRAIDLAEVVVLVLDADAILDSQDLNIAARVLDEGRALVIAVNKWDVAANRHESMLQLKEKLAKSLTQVRGVPTITLSAKTGHKVSELMDLVFTVRDTWNYRVTTSALNQWLEDVTQRHPPPLSKQKRRIKIRYITQAKARPPTFVMFTSRPVDLPTSYHRYLINDLRKTFGFDGVPLRLYVRKPDNPYDPRS